MKLTLAGVSHHKAPIELRERVALDVEACRAPVSYTHLTLPTN